MNTLTTDQLRHEVKNPGNWESLFHLSAELLRRLDIAEAQVAAWRSPGAFVKEGTNALVIEPRTMNLIAAEFSNVEWASDSNCDIDILAWLELPPIPSAAELKELT